MKADPSVARLHLDRFELHEAEARLTCDGELLALAPKPFAVLCALARTPGSLVTKNALLDLVWGHRFVTESVLKTTIMLLSRTVARLAGALARFLAEPVSHPVASGDVLALSPLLRPGDVLLTEGNTRAAALVRRLTRSPWAHVSIYVGRLEAGDDPRCIVEAHISAGVRAVPLSQFNGQRARIARPLGLNATDRQRLADWLVGHIGDPYDLAHAWALCRWFLRLPAPRAMAQDANRFICSSLLVQAFLFVGHPIATSQARSVVPRDFESVAGFEVVNAPPP